MYMYFMRGWKLLNATVHVHLPRLWFSGAGNPGSDLKLAKQLEMEVDQRDMNC